MVQIRPSRAADPEGVVAQILNLSCTPRQANLGAPAQTLQDIMAALSRKDSGLKIICSASLQPAMPESRSTPFLLVDSDLHPRNHRLQHVALIKRAVISAGAELESSSIRISTTSPPWERCKALDCTSASDRAFLAPPAWLHSCERRFGRDMRDGVSILSRRTCLPRGA